MGPPKFQPKLLNRSSGIVRAVEGAGLNGIVAEELVADTVEFGCPALHSDVDDGTRATAILSTVVGGQNSKLGDRVGIDVDEIVARRHRCPCCRRRPDTRRTCRFGYR